MTTITLKCCSVKDGESFKSGAVPEQTLVDLSHDIADELRLQLEHIGEKPFTITVKLDIAVQCMVKDAKPAAPELFNQKPGA